MTTPSSHFILATAGHVDHGKSALVKALTGTDPDRLPEEKARGITIDLGFARLLLPAQAPLPCGCELGIVDVPGHEDFVKNMVAGVGSIDLALLVVAADDGWMPQTEEHLQILTYLGVTRAVVALTKMDLASANQTEVIDSVQKRLQDTPFSGAPIIATSVLSGQGLLELKRALGEVLASTPAPPDLGKPRLPVDRTFVLRGVGTVVTGTLIGGSLHQGQTVAIRPGTAISRIRTIQSHNQQLAAVGPGTRVALNLADLVPAAKAPGPGGPGTVSRGEIVTLPELGRAADTLDVLLEMSRRLSEQPRLARPLLNDGARVQVHHGTGHFPARLVFLDQKQLVPGSKALAQLRFECPVFAFAGDRFVLRDWSERVTIGGGIVLDAEGNRRSFRSAAQRSFLERRAQAPADVTASVRDQLQRDHISRRSDLLVKSSFSALEVARTATALAAAGQLRADGEFVIELSWWQGLLNRAAHLIDAWHKLHPESPGAPLNELRTALEPELTVPNAFGALLAELCRSGFLQAGAAVKRAGHRPALPPHLEAAGAQLRQLLAAKPFEPPSRKELSASAAAQQALRFLIQSGEAVELGPEVVLLADSFAKASELIRKHLQERTAGTVSELRQVVGASRRIVVPLLEKLDRDGVTRRQGDLRTLRH